MSIFPLLLASGFTAGLLGAILGLGGGIFLVPMLSLIFHLPIRLAVGTGLMGVIATSAGAAAVEPLGRGADIGLAMRLEVVTAAGAILGSLLAGRLSSQVIHILFAMVVFFTAAFTLSKAHRKGTEPEQLFAPDYQPRQWPLGLSFAFGAGAVSGLLGVGGGFIKVPVMYAVMGIPLGVAAATSNFMVGITAAASFFVYYGRGDIYALIVVPTTLGVLAGAIAGVKILPYLRAAWIRLGLIGILIVMGIQMLLQGLK